MERNKKGFIFVTKYLSSIIHRLLIKLERVELWRIVVHSSIRNAHETKYWNVVKFSRRERIAQFTIRCLFEW